MSKLITEQKGKVMDDYVVDKEANKEDSEKKNKVQSIQTIYFLLQAHQKTKIETPLKGLKKQKLYDMSSSDSDDK
jgi:hypothetical protein